MVRDWLREPKVTFVLRCHRCSQLIEWEDGPYEACRLSNVTKSTDVVNLNLEIASSLFSFDGLLLCFLVPSLNLRCQQTHCASADAHCIVSLHATKPLPTPTASRHAPAALGPSPSQA